MGPVDGIYLPVAPPFMSSWEEKIAELRQMKLRDDDILLLTYPKAGTHWIWEVITMLRKGTSQPDKHSKVHAMMEFVSVDVMDKLPSPRTLNAHLPFCLLPVDEIRARRLKLVHVYRNPKDICVSAYHMIKSAPLTVAPFPTDTFGHFLEPFMFEGRKLYGSYFRYLRQIHEFQQHNSDVPLFHLAYEDVKKDSVKCVKQLAQFMEVAVSDELCAQIAEACSFDNMKKQSVQKAPAQLISDMPQLDASQMKGRMPVIYRKGQTGDWKNYFTVADNERMDELIKREMKDLPFTLTFE